MSKFLSSINLRIKAPSTYNLRTQFERDHPTLNDIEHPYERRTKQICQRN